MGGTSFVMLAPEEDYEQRLGQLENNLTWLRDNRLILLDWCVGEVVCVRVVGSVIPHFHNAWTNGQWVISFNRSLGKPCALM